MSDLVKALELARNGQWDAAHALAQEDSSRQGSWLHGILHLIEGDEGNARYWYRRAQRECPGMAAIQAELAALEQSL
jgi:hypothetical protein